MTVSPDLITFGESMALFMPQENRALEHADSLQSAFGGAEAIWPSAYPASAARPAGAARSEPIRSGAAS